MMMSPSTCFSCRQQQQQQPPPPPHGPASFRYVSMTRGAATPHGICSKRQPGRPPRAVLLPQSCAGYCKKDGGSWASAAAATSHTPRPKRGFLSSARLVMHMSSTTQFASVTSRSSSSLSRGSRKAAAARAVVCRAGPSDEGDPSTTTGSSSAAALASADSRKKTGWRGVLDTLKAGTLGTLAGAVRTEEVVVVIAVTWSALRAVLSQLTTVTTRRAPSSSSPPHPRPQAGSFPITRFDPLFLTAQWEWDTDMVRCCCSRRLRGSAAARAAGRSSRRRIVSTTRVRFISRRPSCLALSPLRHSLSLSFRLNPTHHPGAGGAGASAADKKCPPHPPVLLILPPSPLPPSCLFYSSRSPSSSSVSCTSALVPPRGRTALTW